MAKPTGRDDPLFDDPTAYLFTDGSAVPNGSLALALHIVGNPI